MCNSLWRVNWKVDVVEGEKNCLGWETLVTGLWRTDQDSRESRTIRQSYRQPLERRRHHKKIVQKILRFVCEHNYSFRLQIVVLYLQMNHNYFSILLQRLKSTLEEVFEDVLFTYMGHLLNFVHLIISPSICQSIELFWL